jgi:hypothetical protein
MKTQIYQPLICFLILGLQFFKKLSDPSTLPTQKNHMMQMVSSPYMFNMLGNPAFSDPQLWSGLVSGAAVPYPVCEIVQSAS